MSALAVGALAAGWLLGWALAGRRRGLPRQQLPGATVASIIVPVRDEADRLPRLLAALVTRPGERGTETIVVDDGSTDGTAEVARLAGAKVVGSEPEPGWTGKAHACQVGADTAQGDVLVFLDADVEPRRDAVERLAATAAATGGLVSAHPQHRVERPYEHLSAGVAVVALLGAGTGGPPRHPGWRRPFAFGPALALPAEAYRAIGGHTAVRSSIVDDVALARAADAAGVPVHGYLGGDDLRYRMYPGGLRQLVEGWTKNIATGGGATPPLRLAAVVLWVTAALQAALALAGPRLGVGLAAYALFALQFHLLTRRIGRFGLFTALAYPLLLAVFVALFAWSAVLTLGAGRVRWRGRTVDVRGAAVR